MDPVYSGKALYFCLKLAMWVDPESYQNFNIVFQNTGGALELNVKGMFAWEVKLNTNFQKK